MQKSNNPITIAIDTNRSVFHFYTMTGGDKNAIAHDIKPFLSAQFSDEFYKEFRTALKEFFEKAPSKNVRNVTVVLPDNAVFCDVVTIPTIKGLGQTKKALDLKLEGFYKNYKELRIIAQPLVQTKQAVTFSILGAQRNIVSSIYAACSENKFFVEHLTYASAATLSGALALNSKLKGANCLFLDIKDDYSRFVFSIGGKSVGFYSLPFGLEFLKKLKTIQEDMLFEHRYAEFTVLSAKARAKKTADAAEGRESASEAVDNALEALKYENNPQMEIKKTPRSLPNYMLRPIPKTKDDVTYENFRIFVKWAMTLIAENTIFSDVTKTEFVCVNLPFELAFLIDTVNGCDEGNGIKFSSLLSGKESSAVLSNLELYGGLFPSQIPISGKF